MRSPKFHLPLFLSVAAGIACLILRAQAITIGFEAQEQYSPKGGAGGTANLKGQPAAGTQWTGGVDGPEAAILVTADDGAGRGGMSVKTQPGSATTKMAEYHFLPSTADLGAEFDAASSLLHYSFQVKIPSVAERYGVNMLRIRIGGPFDGSSAVCLGFGDNGIATIINGDGKGGGKLFFAKGTDGTTNFAATAATYFKVSGDINYAAKTFTFAVNDVPQALDGNANFHFRSDDAASPEFTLINFSADNPAWIPTSIDNIVLELSTPAK